MSAYNFELIKNDETPIMCVFGCLLTESGKKIKKEMLEWLTKKYDVICVNQEPPGDLYEFPGLKFAQQYTIDNNIPILYIHTKGAANPKNVYDQELCREMWKDEFINHYEDYLKLLETHEVVCPFTDENGSTWINGFIATPQAFNKINIPISSNRFIYEHIFDRTFKMFNIKNKINVIGRIANNIDKPAKQLPNIIKHYRKG